MKPQQGLDADERLAPKAENTTDDTESPSATAAGSSDDAAAITEPPAVAMRHHQSPDERLALKLSRENTSATATDSAEENNLKDAPTEDTFSAAGCTSNSIEVTSPSTADSSTSLGATGPATAPDIDQSDRMEKGQAAPRDPAVSATSRTTEREPEEAKEEVTSSEPNESMPPADSRSVFRASSRHSSITSQSQPGAYQVTYNGTSNANVQSARSPEDEWNRQQNQDGVIVVEALAIPDAEVTSVDNATGTGASTISTLTATMAPNPPRLRRQSNTNETASALPLTGSTQVSAAGSVPPSTEFNIATAYAVEEKKTPWYKSSLFVSTLAILCVAAIVIAALGGAGKLSNNNDTDTGTSVDVAAEDKWLFQSNFTCPTTKIVARQEELMSQAAQKGISISGMFNDARFGYAIDLSGSLLDARGGRETIVIGSHKADANGIDESGAAYIYTRTAGNNISSTTHNAWIEEALLTEPEVERNSDYGVKVAVDGDTAIITADCTNDCAGSAYVYDRKTQGDAVEWTRTAKLASDTPLPDAQFGDSVAVRGNTIVVGSKACNVWTYTRGSNSSPWLQESKIALKGEESPENCTSRFGVAVALSRDEKILVVGADKDKSVVTGNRTGAAYVFERQPTPSEDGSIWKQVARLIPDGPNRTHMFLGDMVDIDAEGQTIVVASWKDGDQIPDPNVFKTTQAGAVYVFRRSGSTWKQHSKIVASDGENKDRFGSGISIDAGGTTLLVGAYHDDDRMGSAYLYKLSDDNIWEEQVKFRASGVNRNEFFGFQVSLNDDATTALVSEYGDEDIDISAGAAHTYDISSKCWG